MSLLFASKTYELSLTRDYCRGWGLAQAVRELIQNAIDSPAPFRFEFICGEDTQDYLLVLRSEGQRLSAKTLLLGATSKADDAESIGSFGEGYKIAALVLTRLGYKLAIDNGPVRWTPAFRHLKKYDAEVLVFDEDNLTHKNTDLVFNVQGLSEQEVDEIRGSCLQMQPDHGEVKVTKFGDIMMDRPGLLYVGGLFVCKTELKYGYNIKPEFLKLERDRQTVDNWNLQYQTTQMWYETGDYPFIATMIEAGRPDVSCAEWSSPQMVKQACYDLFRKQHPGKVAAKDEKELIQLVEQGMARERVVYVGGNYSANIRGYLPTSGVSVVKPPAMPMQRMQDWFDQAKYNMGNEAKRSFLDLIAEAKKWTLK